MIILHWIAFEVYLNIQGYIITLNLILNLIKIYFKFKLLVHSTLLKIVKPTFTGKTLFQIYKCYFKN